MNPAPRLPSSRLLRWLPVLLAISLGNGALAEASDAPVEGLLLGVRTRYDFDHPQPTTFLITAVGIQKLGEGLALPRKGGFWWVGNVKREQLVSGATPTLEQFARLVAVPISKKPKAELRSEVVKPGAAKAENAGAVPPKMVDPFAPPPAAPPDGPPTDPLAANTLAPEGPVSASPANGGPNQAAHPCDDDGGDALTFAAGDLLSFQTRRVSYCGGAAPDTWGDLTSLRLGPGQPARVTADQALGSTLGKALVRAGCSADPKCDIDRLGEPDEKMWGSGPRAGRVGARGRPPAHHWLQRPRLWRLHLRDAAPEAAGRRNQHPPQAVG